MAHGEGDDIRYARHPLTFLVEAADDICYTIIDFEDGINLGLIQEEKALEYLINLVRDTIHKEKYSQLQHREDRLSYLRALSINTLIEDAVRIFLENEEEIRKGNFSVGIMDKSKYKAQIDDIIKISFEKIYKSDEVIEKEITGYHVLQYLLDTFITAVENHHNDSLSNYDKLILKVLPENVDYKTNHLYNRLMNVTNYISRLSDSKAVILFNKLTAKTV
jgi:dGTPase